MALTAREWLLLPKEEQIKRGSELSEKECKKLRMELSNIHFTEEEKANMSDEEKFAFIHPKEYTEEEKQAYSQKCMEIFQQMIEIAKNKEHR